MKYEDSTRRRRSKLLLTVGFLAITLAIVRAHFAPMQAYEVSIYAATPPTVWLGIAVAFLAAVAVTAMRPKGWLVSAALGLAILTTATIVFLPAIRGYYGYGQGDALTHLGWARGMITGEMGVMDIFYPGGHTASALLHMVTGVRLSRVMMLFVELLALAHLVFVPLTVRQIVDDRSGTAIAVFSACLFLPITNISTYLDFHAYSVAMFLFPLILFVMFEYLSRHSRALANGVTSTGIVVLLSCIAMVLLHGQVALNVLILFGTIAVAQRFYHVLPGGDTIANARSLAAPTALFGVFYVLWASRYEIVYTMSDKVYDSVQQFLSDNADACPTCGQRSESAAEAGISIIELFMKLFFVKAVFVALAAILVLVALAGRLDDDASSRNEAVTYFAYSGLVLGPFFFAHFVGNVSRYFFRHVGFAMVIATILGAVMLHAFYRAVAGGQFDRTVRVVAAVAIVGALLVSLLALYPSPYIYTSNQGVSEQMMDGYDTAYTYNDSDARWLGVRSSPERYNDALRAPPILKWGSLSEAKLLANNLTTHSPYPYYLAISSLDRGREVEAYNGGTFSEESLNSVADEDGVSKVLSNPDMEVYYVDSSSPPDQGDDGEDPEGNESTDQPPDDQTEQTPEPTATSTPIPEVTETEEQSGDETTDDGGEDTDQSTPEPTEEATATPEPTEEATPEPTPEPTATPEPTPEPTEGGATETEDDDGGFFGSVQALWGLLL